MKDHFNVFSWLLFIASASNCFSASVYIEEEGSSWGPEDERAIAPRIGMHSRVLPVSGSYDEAFMQSLVNMVDNSLEIKMSQDLKTQFSTLEAWTAILTAFSAHNDAVSPFAQNSFSFDLRGPCCVVM